VIATSTINTDWPSIRLLESCDLPSIAEHYAFEVEHGVATFDTVNPEPDYWKQKLIESQNGSYPVWVALDAYKDSKVVGWAGVSRFDAKLAYQRSAEFSFYVLNDYQGRGVGKSLLYHALKQLEVHPTIKTLVSRIAIQQQASVHLHQTFGFSHIGTLKHVGFKQGAPQSVALYQRDVLEA